MKKTQATTICLLLACAFSVAFAKAANDTIPQPLQIVGRVLDADGQCVSEEKSELKYDHHGLMTSFIRLASAYISYSYIYGVLSKERITHHSEYSTRWEERTYTYHHGLLTNYEEVSPILDSHYYRYTYDASKKLIQTDMRMNDQNYEYHHWTYHYTNQGRTKIESYYYGNEIFDNLKVKEQTVFHYDDRELLTSIDVETFDEEETLVGKERTTRTYYDNDLLKAETTRKWEGGQWVNTTILEHAVNDLGLVKERKTGTWSEAEGKWAFDHKATYEYDDQGRCVKVTFYKKEDGRWTWDYYRDTPIWFDGHHDLQQEAIHILYSVDAMFGAAQVHQFEFMYEPTEIPEGTPEASGCDVYPNPAGNEVTVTAEGIRRVELHNLLGQKVATFDGNGSGSLTIDLSNLPKGVYLVTVKDTEGRSTTRKLDVY